MRTTLEWNVVFTMSEILYVTFAADASKSMLTFSHLVKPLIRCKD